LAELQSRESGIAVFVKSRDAKPGAENTILEVQLLFDAANIAEAWMLSPIVRPPDASHW
jgi:hypothetical protein